MKALSYLLRTDIKNWFRQLLKKPGLLVLYALCIVMVAFALIPGGRETMAAGSTDRLPIMRAVVFLIFGLIVYTNISKGLQSGSTFFSMPDVNILFTSPIRPQAVLLYGVIRQMGMSLLATLFLCFQIPNMRNLLHLDGKGIFAVISGWFIVLVCSQVISLSIYSLTAPHPKRRKTGNYLLYGITGAFVLGMIAFLAYKGGDMHAVLDYFAMPFVNYVPIVGWILAYVTGIITGDYLTALLFLVLLLFFPVLGIVFVRRTDSDYYEDVLQATERTYAIRQAAKDGKATMKNSQGKVRTGKSGLVGKGQGASVFFYRHLTEQRRTGLMILDKSSLIIIAAAVIGGLIFQNLTGSGELEPFAVSLIAVGGLSYLLYFLTISGKFTQELSKPFLYLVPAPDVLKLFYSNLSVVLKSFVEGLIAFGIITFFAGLPPWYMLMAALVYASISLLYAAISILTQRILGGNPSKVFQTLIYMLCGGILLVPSLAAFGILEGVFYFANRNLLYVGYMAAVVYNFGISFLVMYLARGVLQESGS